MADFTQIDYNAVLADLEAKKAKIEDAIATIKSLVTGGVASNTSLPGSSVVRPDTFLKMSIPDATKKYLEMTRAKQPTQDIMEALVKGGLPPSKYNTVYAILRRRQSQVGDIINMKGDWALAEWYPNHKTKKTTKSGQAELGVEPELEIED